VPVDAPDDPPAPVGSEAFIEDPYPTYAALRRAAPRYNEILGAWVVTRFNDVSAVLAHPGLSSAGRVHALLQQALPERAEETKWIGDHFDRTLPFLTPPAHTVVRSLLMKALTPRKVEALRPDIERLTDQYLASVDGPYFDLARTLTLPLPMAVISSLLGVPPEDGTLFAKWTADVFTIFSPARDLPSSIDQVATSLGEARSYLSELVSDKRKFPGDDLVSLMIQSRDDAGNHLRHEDIVANSLTMYTAGHETTQGLLGNGLLAILRTPGAADRLRSDRRTIFTGVEEMLRYDSPLQRGWRLAMQDVEIGSSQIRRGDLVAFFLGAANRDPDRFAEPDTFDVERYPNKHLGFGHGPHFCIGAGLARVEAEVVIKAVVHRYRSMTIAGPPIRRRDMTFRVLDSLRVQV
jgi:cytochrome P450